jgi:hypothetical protein
MIPARARTPPHPVGWRPAGFAEEPQPLFHPKAVAKAMAAFPWPADLAERHARLRGLLEQERNGELARTLETEL